MDETGSAPAGRGSHSTTPLDLSTGSAHAKLVLENISKSFGALRANDRVTLNVQRSTVHAILGENGAGKSTLMNILYGLYQPDEGRIILDGAEVSISDPRSALQHGIGMVHQHFRLVEPLTVTENIILGLKGQGLWLDHQQHAEKLSELSASFGFDIDPNATVSKLPIGMQQRVEILKLLYHNAQILVLDEPTSVLIPTEIGSFFDVLRRLKAAGKTILFITHKLEEVMEIADFVTVMQNGRATTTVETAATNPPELARSMVGRDVVFQVRSTAHQPGDVALEVEGLTARNEHGLLLLDGVSFAVRAGEIFGIAGVDGNGQKPLAEAIAGLQPLEAGVIRLAGRDITNVSITNRVNKLGIAYVPEDRHRDALVLGHTVAQNMMLRRYDQKPFATYGWYDFDAIHHHAEDLVTAFNVRLQSVDQEIRYLSGGNQQKVILARELEGSPQLLVVAQPTKGLDVGAIEFVQRQIIDQRDRGVAILYISTELEHLMDVADRIGVVFRGRFTGILESGEATPERLGLLMAGATETP